ncbi:hypothetical protein HYC85_019581 [Camellia sinensis]|uniref:RING-type domain-containing protein n=1 Tax=Camellia sinensis TaxID=4442 RepID=A0A7J7GMB6_CAMSI|nr:hypothetical protein HYC85_019581 [Camellia sinensis]
MNNQLENAAVVEAEEEILDEFQCCAVGTFLASGVSSEPWILVWCHTVQFVGIHTIISLLYPIAYKRREQEVIEEEKISDQFSPQLDNYLSGSEPIKEPYIHSGVPPHSTTSSCNNVSLGPCSIVEGESESTIAPIPAKSTFEATKNVPFGQIGMLGDKFNKQQNSKLVLIADFLCAICKKLLYRPVVLNCGHVYCETCIISPDDKVPMCQVCPSAHPNGNPKVCLVLKHFLEEQFSEQYALRKEAASKQSASQNGSPPTCSTKAPKNASWLSTLPTTDYLSMLSSRGPKVCPIIGERYKCKDCKERIGFDLCEGCYNNSSKLPGRFNQQHTPDHKLEIVPPMDITNLVEQSEEDESDAPEDMEEVPPAPILPGDSPHVPEDGSADPRFIKRSRRYPLLNLKQVLAII